MIRHAFAGWSPTATTGWLSLESSALGGAPEEARFSHVRAGSLRSGGAGGRVAAMGKSVG